jgi:hypothetical protein
VTSCDADNGPISSISIITQDNIKQYFDAAMTNCTNEIPSTRKSRALIFLGS